MNTKPKMTFDAWMKEARRAGKHFWAYEELIDDNPEYGKVAWENGFDPYDYIEREGKRLGLAEFGPAFGGW